MLWDFKIYSGLKCNLEKTLVCWTGAKTFDEDGDLPGFFWQDGNFESLGIIFDRNEMDKCKINLEPKLVFQEVLKIWRLEDLGVYH